MPCLGLLERLQLLERAVRAAAAAAPRAAADEAEVEGEEEVAETGSERL